MRRLRLVGVLLLAALLLVGPVHATTTTLATTTTTSSSTTTTLRMLDGARQTDGVLATDQAIPATINRHPGVRPVKVVPACVKA